MRTNDIKALLKRSAGDFKTLQVKYEQCLHAQTIPSDLKIDIKNLAGNLRSVLDYIANDIRDKYCSPVKPKEQFYFPILSDVASFNAQCAKWYPSLQNSCPDLWAYLESIQPYHQGCEWLSHFNRLNNENKHESLVEQTRTETKRIDVKFNGGRVNWNPDAVKFGPGVRIGGVPVNPSTQMPVPDSSQKVEVIIWVDFRFDGIDVSALVLLKNSLEGISEIAQCVSKWL
jgi:hypothetical protein